ncbi:MAG: hypothetical protein FJY83_03910, partial [Candidatus Aminicenantes bacterium]|nr:hypothetical protein [Candidatus Aminicenantes bacterium]
MSRPALLLACLFLMWTASVDAAEDGPGRFLPPEGALPGLKSEGAARTFRGEQLYDHLNGGAEIFMEYGFKAAVAQDLVDERGRGFVLEIFEMEDDAAAYGLFTYYRTSGGDVPALGDAAHLADYYLGLWSGRHVAIVTAQSGGGEDEASILRLVGRAVADRIPGGGTLPRLPSLLPGGDREPGSEKYFEGGLGFLNSVEFFVGDVFGARRGAKAAFPGGYDVFLLEYERPQESLRAFSRAEGALKEQEGFQDLSDSSGQRFQVAREDGKIA